MDLWKTILLYNSVVFRFHVKCPVCSIWFLFPVTDDDVKKRPWAQSCDEHPTFPFLLNMVLTCSSNRTRPTPSDVHGASELTFRPGATMNRLACLRPGSGLWFSPKYGNGSGVWLWSLVQLPTDQTRNSPSIDATDPKLVNSPPFRIPNNS